MAKRFFSAFLLTTVVTCGYFYYLKSNGIEMAIANAAKLANLETAAGNPSEPNANTPFSLTDQNGKQVTEKQLKGKKLLVFFGFTSCPDVCPVTMAVLTETMNQLENDKITNIQPVFITVDPATDKPETMKKYLVDYHPKYGGRYCRLRIGALIGYLNKSLWVPVLSRIILSPSSR